MSAPLSAPKRGLSLFASQTEGDIAGSDLWFRSEKLVNMQCSLLLCAERVNKRAGFKIV